jgi:hypothetical protein
LRSGDHLKFIRSLPCVVCLTRNNIQAAHIRAANIAYGKRDTGVGSKSSDHWTLPACAAHHDEQHRINELAYWASEGIDPFKTASALFACSGDEEAAEVVVRMARVRP